MGRSIVAVMDCCPHIIKVTVRVEIFRNVFRTRHTIGVRGRRGRGVEGYLVAPGNKPCLFVFGCILGLGGMFLLGFFSLTGHLSAECIFGGSVFVGFFFPLTCHLSETVYNYIYVLVFNRVQGLPGVPADGVHPHSPRPAAVHAPAASGDSLQAPFQPRRRLL